MENKICTKCLISKSKEDFYSYKHKNGSIYSVARCKSCTNKINTENNKLYRNTNKDKVKMWDKNQKIKDNLDPIKHEKKKAQKRESFRRNILHVLWKRTKDRAFKKGIEFDISQSEIQIPDKCPILDIPIYIGDKKNYGNSPSIDRIDNTKGYVKGNWCVISSLANTMKNCATKEQLLKFCEKIPDYIQSNDIVQPLEKSKELQNKESVG